MARARSWLFLKFDSGHSVGYLRSKRISGVDSVLPSPQIRAFDLMSFIHGICALVFSLVVIIMIIAIVFISYYENFIFNSFVRSVTMDKWKDIELEKMKVLFNDMAAVYEEYMK